MSNNNTDFFIQLEWDKSTEDLLVTWSDHAACFTWVYDRSYRRFENLNNRISVPVIVIGTIVGVLTVGITSLFPSDFVDTAQKILGGINIGLAIAGTIQNKYRWAQLSELHLNAFNEWQKFERAIKIELAIDKHDRRTAPEFIRLMRHDYEKLMNSNPILPLEIIDDFKNAFKHSDIIKPEILDTISHTQVFDENKKLTPSLPPVSFMKRMASLIPFTKTYKNKDQIFNNKTPPKTPRSIIREEKEMEILDQNNLENKSRSPSTSSNEITFEIIKNRLQSRDNITIDTKGLDKVYENEDFIVTPTLDREETTTIREVKIHEDEQIV